VSGMPEKFPAAVVSDWGKLEIRDIPSFPLGPYDAVCRIGACSICAATDTHLVDGAFPREWTPKLPFVLGHESAGRVVSVGPKVRKFKVGQLVVRPMWAPDGHSYQGLGSSWGGFSTWGIVRDIWAQAEDTGQPIDKTWQNSLPLPDMPACDATLFVTWRDTLACLMQLGVQPGQRIAVFGTGGNGLAFTRFARLTGAQVVSVGNPMRFERAMRLDANACVDYRDRAMTQAVKDAFDGASADIVIEAVGNAGHLPQMLGCLAEGGRLFLFGIPGDLKYPVNLFHGPSQYTIVKKSVDEWQAHEQVLTYYRNGEIKPVDFCDGELPLEKINDGFTAIRRKDAIKLTIRIA